jgi:predicted lysophospholipase L1 biosynthesis ABC-type transport system permease subunit
VTWLIVCALATVLIGTVTVQRLRPGRDLTNPSTSSHRFPRPWRVAYCVGCFVILLAIMLNSTANNTIRAVVLGVGLVICIVQYVVLETIYGN